MSNPENDHLLAQLTKGSIERLFNDEEFAVDPIVQVVSFRRMDRPDTPQASQVHRVALNDGIHWAQCLLRSDLISLVDEPRPDGNGVRGDDSKFQRGSIIRITAFRVVPQQRRNGRKLVIIHGLEVVSSPSWDKLGTPVGLESVQNTPKPEEPSVAAPPATNLDTGGFYGQGNQQGASNQTSAFPKPQTAPNQHNQYQMTAAAKNLGGFMPINEITPYQNKWSIRATCSRKFDIKTWAKPTSTGKLFSVNLMDESGEIRATGFNTDCDRLYDLFEENVVYYISSPCTVKYANKQFSNTKHDYELTFERETRVEKASDQSNAPAMKLDFVSIGKLGDIAKDEVINVVGILKEIGEETQLTSKTTNRPYSKRDLTIVDDSLHSVRLTIWGNSAQNFNTPLGAAIVFKGAKVSDFGGKSLSLLSSGSFNVNPDMEEVFRIKGWYDSVGRNDNFTTFANAPGSGDQRGKGEIYTIQRVKDEGLGSGDEPQYFSIKATVAYFNKDNFCYTACASEGCNRKVTEVNIGAWRCEKCNIEHPQPIRRFVLNINVSDFTGQLWLSCFDESGRVVMGMSADALNDLKNSDDEGFLQAVDTAAFQTFFFRCRAKKDTYNDVDRIRYQVLTATPVSHSQEGNRLASLIQQYEKATLGDGAGDDASNSLFTK